VNFYDYETEMDLPETWDAMIPNETFRKVRLKATSPEFKTVAKSVKATAQFVNGEKIIKVSREVNLLFHFCIDLYLVSILSLTFMN